MYIYIYIYIKICFLQTSYKKAKDHRGLKKEDDESSSQKL